MDNFILSIGNPQCGLYVREGRAVVAFIMCSVDTILNANILGNYQLP